MKILLLGRDGQVGWELQRSLAPLGELVALGRQGSADLVADLSNLDALAQTVRAVAPDVIVNAAAYTAVDQAEVEPDLARVLNADAPAVLAREASKLNAWLLHYSTDYVFDGSGNRPWQETDATQPLNVYGETKLQGEQAIRDSGCRHLILRTSWVYAARGQNFVRTMLRLAEERETLHVIDDQIGAPTGAELIANITAHALTVVRRNADAGGLYHVAAAGETSWHGLACFLIERGRALGWPLRVATEDIVPVATEAFPTAASRPQNSRLDCALFLRTFGFELPDWRVGVERVLKQIRDQEISVDSD